MFRVPVPRDVAERPLPEAQLLAESTPVPPPADTRPAPRPVYKQTRDTPAPDDKTRDKAERRPGERSRRRRRIRAPETNVPRGVLIAGGIMLLTLVGGLAYAIIHFSAETPGPKPLIPVDAPSSSVAEGPAIPTGPTVVDLPKTWSMNAPSLGFVAAWPVLKGNLGYTPVEALSVAYSGLKPNSWSYIESTQRIMMSVSVIDLIEVGSIDAEATIDRYVDKMRPKAPTTLGVTPMTIAGQPARQIAYVTDSERSISRVTLKGNRLWTVSVVCPQTVAADDPKVVRFLSLFEPI
jgi:hypothetical protein